MAHATWLFPHLLFFTNHFTASVFSGSLKAGMYLSAAPEPLAPCVRAAYLSAALVLHWLTQGQN